MGKSEYIQMPAERKVTEWINIMSNEKKRIFSTRSKSICPEFSKVIDRQALKEKEVTDLVRLRRFCISDLDGLKTRLDEAGKKSLVFLDVIDQVIDRHAVTDLVRLSILRISDQYLLKTGPYDAEDKSLLLSTHEERKEKFEALEKAWNILKYKLSTYEQRKKIFEAVLEKLFNTLKDKLSTHKERKEQFEALEKACNILKYKGREATRLMPEQMLSDDWINILSEEVRRKFINRSKSIHPEDSLGLFKLLVDITTTSEKTGEEPVEDYLTYFKLSCETTTISDKTGENSVEINILPEEVSRKFINRSKSIHPEDSLGIFKLPDDITTTSDKTGEEPVEVKNAAAEKRSKQESTPIKLYRKVIRNETCRMMTSIDMVVSEAKHLFGVERTQIFFDLLDDRLLHFGPAGTASDFVPNMAESSVRQNVSSFFEHSHDTMNQLMTLLLGCPDSKRFQQMSEKSFISLMESVIDTSLKTKTKGGKKLSSEESTFIMVDSKEFVRALGEEIPGEVLNRLKRGDEVIAHMLVDTRLEGTQASERREKRIIHSIYFPKDYHLFIHIPTENGSYWHQMDMQRASRLRRHYK